MVREYTKAQMRATDKHIKECYWRPSIIIPKARRAAVEEYCYKECGSVNKMVNILLREALGMTEAEWKDRG